MRVPTPRYIHVEDERGRDTDQIICSVRDAEPDDVARVLNASTIDPDGRSQWLWLRLHDGTLALGCFPQGATYEWVSESAPFPIEVAPA